jgi:vacuolar protein sorting-associated protein 13A/C
MQVVTDRFKSRVLHNNENSLSQKVFTRRLFVCMFVCLLQSAMDEKSLYGTFTLHPWDRDVNWMLKAKAAPCYVTVRLCSGAWLLRDDDQSCTFSYIFLYLTHLQVLMPSINRVTQFFSSKEAVSQRVALQTAAALQV